MTEKDTDSHPPKGRALLNDPRYNKGTAFTRQERIDRRLLGLLPPHVETLDEQVKRAYKAYRRKQSDLERHIYLRRQQESNEILFYRLLLDNLTEMMPIVYTPTVGQACQQYSHIYRHPEGLFISYPERDAIDRILENARTEDVRVIVVTDGERVLGLGDQGAGGMGIPLGKLTLYTACGGVDPAHTLPILLDVGTDNQSLLDDPLYVGWRHERIRGREYFDFIETFVSALKRRFPGVLLQWEDFARSNAHPLLARYRDRICSFNDDIQGTAAVVLAPVLAAMRRRGGQLKDQRIAIMGAGSAGCGVAEQLINAMVQQGLSEKEARNRFYMIDQSGLLTQDMNSLTEEQKPLAQPPESVEDWDSGDNGRINLQAVVDNARPGVLIGACGQAGIFTEDVVKSMAELVERPAIFPLSNPNSQAEAKPEDLLRWSAGKALVATGSPFENVEYEGKTYSIAQCNNAYIFPGVGLGVLAASASRVSDEMFTAAARTLSELGQEEDAGGLLPPLHRIREVGQHIAVAVAETAHEQGYARVDAKRDMASEVERMFWEPRYSPAGKNRQQA